MTPMSYLCLVLLTALTLGFVESFKKLPIPLRKPLRLQVSPTRLPPSPQRQKSLPSNSESSDVWRGLTATAKEAVKSYFIHRAEEGGIPWKDYYNLGASNMDVLLQNYLEIMEPSIVYPDYYTQTFHSYAEGNLNWEAALEVAAATISISASYWPEATVAHAEQWMRGNTTSAIHKHSSAYEATLASISKNTGKIMDVGCSIGASTKFLIEAFPDKDLIDAVDLSPYFLAAAKFYHKTIESPMFTALSEKINYHHMMAESLEFPADSYDVVSISFLLHEVPTETAKQILSEAFRVLRPGGTLSILDLCGTRIKNLPQIRKHFFELTEPHIKQYYKTDPMKILADNGFTFIETMSNDPMNSLWLATKPSLIPLKAVALVQDVGAPTAITALGKRLSAGATHLKSLIQSVQPEVPLSVAPSITKEESLYRALLNFFTAETLWRVIRTGAIFYFTFLLLGDFTKHL